MNRGKLVHSRSSIDMRRSRTRRMQFIIYIFVKIYFYFNLRKKRCSEASCFNVGYSLSYSNFNMSEIIS